jgi:hypothetical protein
MSRQRGVIVPELAVGLALFSLALGAGAYVMAPRSSDCNTPAECPGPSEPPPAVDEYRVDRSRQECTKDSDCPEDRPLCRRGKCRVVDLSWAGLDKPLPSGDSGPRGPKPDAPKPPQAPPPGTPKPSDPCCDQK